jgi:ubiquitin fusion degradation protein 1
MMQNLAVEVGGVVQIKTVKLEKGSFIKIQPHETAFIDLPNPRAVYLPFRLENALRDYSCLTQGETIIVEFNKRRYELDILETRPKAAIMTIETDIEVDFAPPKDYVESPSKLTREPSITAPEEAPHSQPVSGKQFPGSGQRLDKKELKAEAKKTAPVTEEYDPRKHRLRHGIRSATGPKTHWEDLKPGRLLD